MEIIANIYKPIVSVHCGACAEYHTAIFNINVDYGLNHYIHNPLYVEIKEESKFNFKYRLKEFFKFAFNYKEYYFGKYITNHGIIIYENQSKELYDVLKKYSMKYNILSEDEFKDIEKDDHIFSQRKYPIKFIRYDSKAKKKSSYISDTEFTWTPIVNEELVVSVDVDKDKDYRINREFVLGYKLEKGMLKYKGMLKRTAWRFLLGKSKSFFGGEYSIDLTKHKFILFLKFLYYFNSYKSENN